MTSNSWVPWPQKLTKEMVWLYQVRELKGQGKESLGITYDRGIAMEVCRLASYVSMGLKRKRKISVYYWQDTCVGLAFAEPLDNDEPTLLTNEVDYKEDGDDATTSRIMIYDTEDVGDRELIFDDDDDA
ncbi:hypothetical protein HAX54_018313 [Datura stramonium]|uniref:Uncharacterized protein n=1 Tax=Datura stramonium TaxID=4076 RepID=A0ABS8UM53_DATST|nr:hypothetical protein [Datura stramonium]